MAGYVTFAGMASGLFGSGYLLYAGSSGLQYLGLFLFSTVIWLMVTWATVAEKALEAARTGKPAGGVSFIQDLVPIVVFTYLAWLVDWWWPPYGLWVVVGLHAMLGTYALFDGVRSCWMLDRLETGRRSDGAPVH